MTLTHTQRERIGTAGDHLAQAMRAHKDERGPGGESDTLVSFETAATYNFTDCPSVKVTIRAEFIRKAGAI